MAALPSSKRSTRSLEPLTACPRFVCLTSTQMQRAFASGGSSAMTAALLSLKTDAVYYYSVTRIRRTK